MEVLMSAKQKKKVYRRKDRPKNLTTKEELIEYLNNNQDVELPFVEECWEAALAKIEEKKDEQITETIKIHKSADGEEKISRNKANIFQNPVSVYFQLMGLKKYKSIGEELRKQDIIENDYKAKLEDIYFDFDDKDSNFVEEDESTSNVIVDWINTLHESYERKFVTSRYLDYMNSYEINEGVGKTSLKGLLSIELELDRIDRKRAKGQEIKVKDEKDLRTMQKDIFDSMKWQPKQRNAREEMAANKFTVLMDKMVKEGKFIPTMPDYDKDKVDELMDIIMDSRAKMIE